MPMGQKVVYLAFAPPDGGGFTGRSPAVENKGQSCNVAAFPVSSDFPDRMLSNCLLDALKKRGVLRASAYLVRPHGKFGAPPARLTVDLVLSEHLSFGGVIGSAEPKIEIFGRENRALDCKLVCLRLIRGLTKPLCAAQSAAPEEENEPAQRLVLDLEVNSAYLVDGPARRMFKRVKGVIFNLVGKRIVVNNEGYDSEAGDLCSS
jgi:hypothetical protein